MFKLAEMFVEIKGQDEPFQAVLGSLKSKAGSMASSLGSSIGGAFTAALSPVGLAFSAIKGLFSMVEEGNESVEKLGTYWEEAIAPIKALLTEAVTHATEWITSLYEMVKTNEYVVAAFKMLQDYGEAAIENVKVAIDRGIEVFEDFKKSAQEVFTGAVIILTEFGETISKVFGESGGQAAVKGWGETIQEWVIDKIQLAGVIVRNWPEFFEIARLSIAEKIANIGNAFAVLPENLSRIGNYVAHNWKALFIDSLNAIGAAFNNLGTYIGEFGYSIYEFFKDPTKGVKLPEWKGLLDGFKATADKLPELIKPAMTSYADEIQAQMNKITQNELKGFEKHKAAAKAAAEETAATVATTSDKFKSSILGVAEFHARQTSAIFSDKNDIPAAQLKEAKETNKKLDKIADKPQVAHLG